MAICAISFLTSIIFQSLRLRLEEGKAQVFAAGLAVELRLFADGGRSPAAFAPDLEGVGGAEVEGVLAVSGGEGVDRLVELPDLLRPERFSGEIRVDSAGTPRFSLVLCCYVSIPRVVLITVDGVVVEGGMTEAIRGVFAGRRCMGLCGRSRSDEPEAEMLQK